MAKLKSEELARWWLVRQRPFLHKPDFTDSIPRAHRKVDRENPKLSSDLRINAMNTSICTCAHIHTQ